MKVSDPYHGFKACKCLLDDTGAALAQHIGDSKIAQIDQQSLNLKISQTQRLMRRKEITAWLAPAAYDVEYYSNDLANARALRHPNTCKWVLDKQEMIQLSNANNEPQESLVWISANPGAGKTILSSFLIDHFMSGAAESAVKNVFYFFCKETDADKNTAVAVSRTLLYQLYNSVKDQEVHASLDDDVGLALDRSGQQKAVNFTVLWELFANYVQRVTPSLIILDALDECQDSGPLIEGLKKLSILDSIRVILTSRKESHLHTKLQDSSSIEITPEDINTDIAAFVEAKVDVSSRLSHPLVRNRIITKLCNAHDGMFLWVYLMLKELKSCFSVTRTLISLMICSFDIEIPRDVRKSLSLPENPSLHLIFYLEKVILIRKIV